MKVKISICQGSSCVKMAVFPENDFDTIKDFQEFPDERAAMDDAKKWCQDNGHEVVQVVHPMVTRMSTWTSRTTRGSK